MLHQMLDSYYHDKTTRFNTFEKRVNCLSEPLNSLLDASRHYFASD